jgi:hypothetical protein
MKIPITVAAIEVSGNIVSGPKYAKGNADIVPNPLKMDEAKQRKSM